MSLKEQYKTLYRYHDFTTRKLLQRARNLDPPELNSPLDYGRGSIIEIFLHILRASHSWRLGLETRARQAFPNPESYDHLDALEAGFDGEKKGWALYLDSLTDAKISEDIELIDSHRTLVTPRWRILQHVLFHGMQHHSELAQILTVRGNSPGDLDFILFAD
ncbi:MAG: DinB family protein [Anaerolineales bacterium]|nr:DinB family protein [Anaerolineales bacterium]